MSSIIHSTLFKKNAHIITLQGKNHRARNDVAFAKWLIKIGNDSIDRDETHLVPIPKQLLSISRSLIDDAYPELLSQHNI